MGVIALALIATGHIDAAHFYVPTWVKLICATSMALGTASGGWRIINTMGNRITTVESPQGFSAEASSAATILASSYYGYPLSTTQTVSGGVMGAGLGKRGGVVHWPVVGQMVTAWVITLPSAAPRPVHSLNRVGELVDSYRYRLSGAADLYLSTVANRQGEVNKQLTIIATTSYR
jgi:PiT family inorganic phosphate transporter